jgi:hypothetical protein
MAMPEPTASSLPLALPLATPIEVSTENAVRLGLNSTHTGRLAIASDRQVSDAVAAEETSLVSQGPTEQTEIRVQVRLMDGTVTGARVVNSRSGVALVELDDPLDPPGRQLASLTPGEAEQVMVLSDEPHAVSYAQLTRRDGDTDSEPLNLIAGTPVVTADGELLGICVEQEQGEYTHFISVGELLFAAISQRPTPQRPSHPPAQSQDR